MAGCFPEFQFILHGGFGVDTGPETECGAVSIELLHLRPAVCSAVRISANDKVWPHATASFAADFPSEQTSERTVVFYPMHQQTTDSSAWNAAVYDYPPRHMYPLRDLVLGGI